MKKVLLFGDSITAGYGTEAITPILPQLIIRALKAQQYEAIHVINAGVPGDTSDDGLQRLITDVIEPQPDIVTIFFGANDTNSDRLISLEKYVVNIQEMIEQIGKEKIILITPPSVDCGRNPTHDDQRIRDYVAAILNIGAAYKIPVVNCYQTMKEYSKMEDLLQDDGLHFSKKGYEQLANLIVEALKGRLKSSKLS